MQVYVLVQLVEVRAIERGRALWEWAVRRMEAVDPAPCTMERKVDLHQLCTLVGAWVYQRLWVWALRHKEEGLPG